MTDSRIYYPGLLEVGQEVTLDQITSHRLLHVLRLRNEARLIIFNGHGGQYTAQIILVTKKIVVLKIVEHYSLERESPLNLCLAQALARSDKMDFILQKAVEIGVTKITPLYTKYCNVRLSPAQIPQRILHWQKVIVHACEQSGRNRIPQLEAPQPYMEWLTTVKPGLGLILAPDAENSLSQLKDKVDGKISLVVGCEGGLHPDEIAAADARGFIAVRLGPRVLRTETAGIVAAAIVQFYFGDLGMQI